MTPDVNVLVAASRSDHPHHKVAYAWLDDALAACANGGTLRLLPMVVASYLRLVTNVRIFVDATPVESAVDFIDALSTEPGVEMPAVGAEWPLLRQMCVDKGLRANDIPDAWIAACVNYWGEHLVTFDADFKKLLRPSQVTILEVAS